ncbi:hypothetical protein [Mycobacterium conspicuum]|nr:hypothetical protein [Mycobacterium conspicuum]ORV37796.1 hypothetical protein AWC00_22325 [Mycobacterium conspicuum]
MQAMAELAEAEAAEAEALAASARARARAVRLRRQVELAEASESAEAQTAPAGSELQDNATPGTMPDALSWYRRWLRRPRLSSLAAILTIAVITSSLAATVYMVMERHDASQQRQRTTEFAAAARQGVMALTSLDCNNAKRDVQRILDNSTGSFKADMQKMADDFAKAVEESKVVEQGAVESVAVDLDSMTRDSAVVLVASKSDVTNAAGAKQDPREFRLIVTVVRDGGQLKMSKVQFVP